MKKLILFVAGMVFLAGCGGKKESVSDVYEYTFASVDSIAIESFEVVFPDKDSLGLSMPMEIVMLDSTRLIVKDARDKFQVKIVDVGTGGVQQLVAAGEGPEELLSVNSIQPMSDAVWVSGNFDNKMGVLTPDSVGNYRFELKGKTDYPFMKSVVLENGKVLTIPSVKDKIRFLVTDLQTMQSDSLKIFPKEDENVNNTLF